MLTDEWRDIDGLEGFYQVRADGVVRSLDRVINGRRFKSRIMRPWINSGGYLMVGLRKEGKNLQQCVHRLLAMAFIQNPHGHTEVDHLNGNKLDNRIENLAWMPRHENVQMEYDAKRRRRDSPQGASHHKAKLSEADVAAIRKSRQPDSALAGKYQVSLSAIKHIKKNRSWRHLPLSNIAYSTESREEG